MLFGVFKKKSLCVLERTFFSVQKMETETTVLTGDTSNESIEALNFGEMTPQKKNVWITVLWVFLVIVVLTGAGIGGWQLYNFFTKKNDKEQAKPLVCIGHVTKVIDNKVYVMNQPTESSVVTFTDVADDPLWRMKPAWQQQDGKLVAATGLILTYSLAQDTFTLEEKSDSPWQLRWEMDDDSNGKGILHTTDPNGMKKYLQVRTKLVTLSSDRKLACLTDTEEAGQLDTPVYANKICRASTQPSPTTSDNPTHYDDAFLCEQAGFKWGVPPSTPTGTAHPIWGPEIPPARCYRDDPANYNDKVSCEHAKFKWGTPSWEPNPGGGPMIQLQRCYKP